MSARFEQAELLKKQYTDKFVVVKSGAPELKRFQGLTGVVKTVNMSCRALVMFDGTPDIGWYDIDPTFLTLVDAPVAKKAEGKTVKEPPAAKEAPPAIAAPAPKPAGEKKLSPLEMIRQQAAAGAKPAAAAPAATAAGGAKPSPIDLIRKQAAAKAERETVPAVPASNPAPVAEAAPAPVAAPQPAAPAAPTPAAAADKKLSPIEMIRLQAAAKGKK